MEATSKFRPAVWVSEAPFKVRSIETLGDAYNLLQECSPQQRTRHYQTALDMVEQCAQGSVTLETARRTFRNYLREAGLLAEADPADRTFR